MLELLRAMLNLPMLALVMCRSAGIMIAAPLLSSASVPMRVKAALSFLLGVIMLPFAATDAAALPAHGLAYVPLALSELGLGLLIGFSASLVLAALEAAGGLMAHQIGLALASVASPDDAAERGVISVMLGLFGLMLFLAVDGHHWLIQALAVSYRKMPLGQAPWNESYAGTLDAGFSAFLVGTLRIAAPLMGMMFLVTVVIALVAKAVPQMNILLVGYPVKVLMGVVGMVLTFPLIWPVLRGAFGDLHARLLSLVR